MRAGAQPDATDPNKKARAAAWVTLKAFRTKSSNDVRRLFICRVPTSSGRALEPSGEACGPASRKSGRFGYLVDSGAMSRPPQWK